MAEATSAPVRPGAGKLIAGFVLVILAGLALAWLGAGSMRADTSASGLTFRVISEGKGAPIGDADAALIDYVGSFDDGTVFDSSQNHGGPQPFAKQMVFPGFAEAMGRMREGGHYRFSFPQALAFGDGPPPPGFPPDSDLNFEVKVAKVVPGGAAMMQQQVAPPR